MVFSVLGDLLHNSIGYGPGSEKGIHCSYTTLLKEAMLRKHERGEGGMEAWLQACSLCKTRCTSQENLITTGSLEGRLVSNVLLYHIQRRKD